MLAMILMIATVRCDTFMHNVRILVYKCIARRNNSAMKCFLHTATSRKTWKRLFVAISHNVFHALIKRKIGANVCTDDSIKYLPIIFSFLTVVTRLRVILNKASFNIYTLILHIKEEKCDGLDLHSVLIKLVRFTLTPNTCEKSYTWITVWT